MKHLRTHCENPQVISHQGNSIKRATTRLSHGCNSLPYWRLNTHHLQEGDRNTFCWLQSVLRRFCITHRFSTKSIPDRILKLPRKRNFPSRSLQCVIKVIAPVECESITWRHSLFKGRNCCLYPGNEKRYHGIQDQPHSLYGVYSTDPGR